MKIVQLVPELNEGGVERGTVEFSRELIKNGHQSVVISKGGTLARQVEAAGGQHLVLDLCSKNLFSAPWRINRLRQTLKKLQPDLLHARSRVPAWLAYMANRGLGLPLVTTVHGIYSVNSYSRIMTRGDRVICISEVLQEQVCKHYGLDRKKITVIQRGVDLDSFDPAKLNNDFIKDFKGRYKLAGKFIVASIGRVTYLKDYETFIKAIALTREQLPNLVGVIVGGTTKDKQAYLQKLQELAGRLGVADAVVFAGSQTMMPEIYALSDLTVNASLTMGNVGRTVIESLAMNTPVLATSYKGLANVVQDGENGYIIATNNPADLAAKILLASRTSFHNLRHRLDREYTLPAMVEKTIQLYQELLRQNKTAA